MLHPVSGKNAIHMLVESENKELLLQILGDPDTPNCVDLSVQSADLKMTPLHMAAKNNKRDLLTILLRESVKYRTKTHRNYICSLLGVKDVHQNTVIHYLA